MNFAIDTFPPERFGLVTGSRCSPLVPKRDAQKGQITLAKELAKERFFQHYDDASTWQTEHGKMSEGFALQHYLQYFDSKIEVGEFGFVGDVGWSPDAVASDYGADWKCPTTLQNFLDYLTDGISDYEYNQAQLYMMGLKKDRWIIGAYLAETSRMNDNGLRYPVKEQNRMIINEVKASQEWVDKFNSNLPFVTSKRDEYIEMYKLKFK
jgi:hypothetical protein